MEHLILLEHLNLPHSGSGQPSSAGLPWAEQPRRAVTIGFFEGLHPGHQAVIRTAVAAAQKAGLIPTLFTFETDHQQLPKARFSLLTTGPDKEELLHELGIAAVFAPPFDAVCHLSCEETVAVLLEGLLHAGVVVAGEDLRFGYRALGDLDTLRALCARRNIQVIGVPPVLDDGLPISATRIRAALEAGDPATATRLLGRPFGFAGLVVDGNRIGHTIGFPTVNQELPPRLVRPKRGVYRSRLTLPDGRVFAGMTNIGTKPTVGGHHELAESYLHGFCGDLYGQILRLELLEYLRPETKFDSLEGLRTQLTKDAIRCFGNHGFDAEATD